MEPTHTDNESPVEAVEQSETVVDETPSPVDTELDEAVAGALGEIDNAPADWSDDDEDEEIDEDDEQADDDDDTDAEASDEAPQVDRQAAIDALIQSGMKPGEVMALSEEDILRQGAEKLAAQTEQAQAEAAEVEDQPEISDEDLLSAIGEELGSDFSDSEKERIGKAISKAVDLKRYGKYDFAPHEKKIADQVNELKGMRGMVSLLSAEVEKLAVASARSSLSETFPQLADDANMDKVMKAAAKYMPQCDTVQDAIQMGAFSLFGKEQTQKLKQHQGKVHRAKKAGKPTKRASVARDEQTDDVTAAAVRAVEKHLDL